MVAFTMLSQSTHLRYIIGEIQNIKAGLGCTVHFCSYITAAIINSLHVEFSGFSFVSPKKIVRRKMLKSEKTAFNGKKSMRNS